MGTLYASKHKQVYSYISNTEATPIPCRQAIHTQRLQQAPSTLLCSVNGAPTDSECLQHPKFRQLQREVVCLPPPKAVCCGVCRDEALARAFAKFAPQFYKHGCICSSASDIAGVCHHL